MTKERAIVIAMGLGPRRSGDALPAYNQGITDLLRALDSAHAFPSEAALAEIEKLASEILARVQAAQPNGADAMVVAKLGLALATACRAAGLVKP